jgi:hypothetical protein
MHRYETYADAAAASAERAEKLKGDYSQSYATLVSSLKQKE